MNQEEIQKLRSQLVDELVVLVDETDLEPEDKFDIIVNQYTMTGDIALLKDAHKAATGIKDVKEKGAALLWVLNEIDLIGEVPAAEPENTPSDVASDEVPVEQ